MVTFALLLSTKQRSDEQLRGWRLCSWSQLNIPAQSREPWFKVQPRTMPWVVVDVSMASFTLLWIFLVNVWHDLLKTTACKPALFKMPVGVTVGNSIEAGGKCLNQGENTHQVN